MPQSKHQPPLPDLPPGGLRHGQRANAEIHSATTGYPGRSARRGQEQGSGPRHGGRADHEDLIVAARAVVPRGPESGGFRRDCRHLLIRRTL
jgi:hypothetical protein